MCIRDSSGNPLGSLNRTYTIRPGDTLGLIALRTGVDSDSVSYTHLRAHETVLDLVCRLLLEKKHT